MTNTMMSRALEGIRVLELPGPLTSYCGKLLANLGAEVVLVEPPAGSAMRRRGPQLDIGGPDRSVAFFYTGTDKRSITLDLEQPRGRDVFRSMAESATVVLEGEGPGGLEGMGLAPDVLMERNPGLVVTRVSAFGQTGPYASYQSTDLTALAMGGLLSLGGYVDSEPMRAGGEQAYATVNIFAAMGTMMAVLASERDGRGQEVDLSMQEAICMTLENAVQYYEQENLIRSGTGGTQRTAGQGVFPCADGYVYVLAGGIAANRFWDPFVRWMLDRDAPGADLLTGPEWRERDHVESDEAKATFAEVFGGFASQFSKHDLYHEAQGRGVPLCPVNTALEVGDNEQLRARGYFVKVRDDERGLVTEMPGPPYRHSATPWDIRRPAPMLGEFTMELLEGLGHSSEDIAELTRQGVI